jgi:hypothetical protein
VGSRDADEDDVENDRHVAGPDGPRHSAVPSLPPRPAPPVATDVDWLDPAVEPPTHPEPAVPPRASRSKGRRRPFLLPTAAARVLATMGWLGTALAWVLLLGALIPYFEDGDARGFWIALEDDAWFSATLIVSGIVVYLGWLWWAISAAFNVRRVSIIGTSPWLPTMVYLVGPLIVLASPELDTYSDVLAVCGIAWIGIGHLVVVASFRKSAARIGGLTDEFSKLLWLPLAWLAYRGIANAIVTFTDDAWRKPVFLFVIGAIGALFPLAMASAVWRATEAFDHACRRLNSRGNVVDLPSAELVTAAIRKRALEGR